MFLSTQRTLCWTLGVGAILFYSCLALAQEIQHVPATSPNPTRLPLQGSLDLARKNSTVFQSAVTDAAVAKEDKNQARDSLLLSVASATSEIYTEGNGPGST